MLNNRATVITARILLLMLIGVIITDLFFSSLSGSLSAYFEGHFPAIISTAIIVLMLILNLRYFSFSDDHEFIHIKSRLGLLPVGENPAEVNFEFLKKNIADFRFDGWGSYRRLYLKLHSAYRGSDQYRFNISFMSSDEVARMRNCLNRAIEKSAKEKHPQLATVG